MKKARHLSALALLVCAACASGSKNGSTGPLIEAFGMTTLYSANPVQVADWYGRSFRVPFAREDGGYVAKDSTGLGPIWIVVQPAPEGAKPRPIDVSFFVRNLDQVLGHLSSVGVSPLRIDRDKEGRPRAIVLDPEGNRIELVQR